jgi:hypothetical protein
MREKTTHYTKKPVFLLGKTGFDFLIVLEKRPIREQLLHARIEGECRLQL